MAACLSDSMSSISSRGVSGTTTSSLRRPERRSRQIGLTLVRIMNANIAEYHMPVNADVGDIKVIFVAEQDNSNPLGLKGVGEIGIVGVAPAVANAVYHATGTRVRDLPITLDKLRR